MYTVTISDLSANKETQIGFIKDLGVGHKPTIYAIGYLF